MYLSTTHIHTCMSTRLQAYSAYAAYRCVWVDWGCWVCCSETGAVPEPRNFSAGAADGGADSACRQRQRPLAVAVGRTRRPPTAACRCAPPGHMEWGPAVGFGKLESWATGALKHSGTRGLQHGATSMYKRHHQQYNQHTHCQQKTHKIMNSPLHTMSVIEIRRVITYVVMNILKLIKPLSTCILM